MSILHYFAICLLAIHQVQSDQSGTSANPLSTKVPSAWRIVRGDLALPGEFKYIVVTFHDDKYYMCGGGIIDNYYVLTAAHCVINAENEFGDKTIKVVAGTNDYNNEADPRRVVVEVEKVYTPEGYNSDTYPNDIALLKLKGSLNITENDLEKLSLPNKARNLTNRMAVMAGFGYDKHQIFFNFRTNAMDEKFDASGYLRKADIKMYSNDECQDLYKDDEIYDSYLCGKMVKESQRREYGVCNGDSGSPLVLNSKVVVGVVSWSYGCDEREVPLVYTRVHSFLDFIKNAKKDKTENMRVNVYE